MNDTPNKKKSKLFMLVGLILAISVIAIAVYSYSHLKNEQKFIIQDTLNKNDSQLATPANTQAKKLDTNFLNAAIVSENDTAEEFIRISDSNRQSSNFKKNDEVSYTIDDSAGVATKTIFTGRRINIAITGIDGRVGAISRHADANHVISILIDSGKIEITSIPRDTYCDLGYDDTTGLNKLTICRSNKGRSRYLKELARIARVDKIHYYVEFGFSQAMGIIEWLGYKDPANTLQVLRNRKGLGGDDYQRCYNQGQFIRQAVLSHFSKFTGTLGPVFIRGGLFLVETNLTYDAANDIVKKLEAMDFPQSKENVTVKVRPPIKINYKLYDFNDQNMVDNMINKVEKFNKSRYTQNIETPQPNVNVEKKLNNVIEQAVKDSAKNPTLVINKLSPYFEQRAWYQVQNKQSRDKIREQFGILLYSAYNKKNKSKDAENVKAIINSEKQLFQ